MTDLRIHSVSMKNMMRLTDVQISFDGQDNLIIVGGRNEQGKSSFMDGIQLAFTTGKVSDMPIHQGAKRAEETIALMDDDGTVVYTVEKIVRPSGTEVTVYDAEGKQLPDGRAFLDDLTARGYGFDPVAFSRQCDTAKGRREQFETLKELLGLDFTEHDAERKATYDERTAVNNRVKQLEAQIAGIPHHKDIPADIPSLTDLTARLNEAYQQQAQIDQLRAKFAAGSANLQAKREKIKELREEAARLEEEAVEDADALVIIREQGKELVAVAIDPEPLKAQLANVETLQRQINDNQERQRLQAELEQRRGQAEEMTKLLEELDQTKREVIAAAPMPIPDLSINDEEQEVLYQGRPLSVASAAGKLRVSVALGIAMLSKLKVLLIREGSCLDRDNLRLIGQMARAAGVQVLIERPEIEGASFVIENGEVADSETVFALIEGQKTAMSRPVETEVKASKPVAVNEDEAGF